MKVTITGTRELLKRLQDMLPKGEPLVQAGVLEGATSSTGESVAQYAIWNEFGAVIPVTDKMRGYLAAVHGVHLRATTTSLAIPARSFMRLTYEQCQGNWLKTLAYFLKQGASVDEALEEVGRTMKEDIEATLDSQVPPPNSSMTNFIKQTDAPASVGMTLRHTGSLRASIEYRVGGEQ